MFYAEIHDSEEIYVYKAKIVDNLEPEETVVCQVEC